MEMSLFYSFGIAKYARFVEWGGGGTNFLNEFGDTPFFVDLTFSYYLLPYVEILSNLYHFYKSSK